MSTKHQNDSCELAELEVVAGGGYIPQRIGLGARTDFMIVQKQLLESNFRSPIVAPTLP